MAATQRPGALAALVTPSGPPAWAEIPSWYLVASQDRIIPPEAERAMAERAGSTVVEIDSSHVAMMSHPSDVTRLHRSKQPGSASPGAGWRRAKPRAHARCQAQAQSSRVTGSSSPNGPAAVTTMLSASTSWPDAQRASMITGSPHSSWWSSGG